MVANPGWWLRISHRPPDCTQATAFALPVSRSAASTPSSRHDDVKVTMSLPADVPLPADVNAVVMAPNLVAARFIQLAPAYESGPLLPAGATVELSRTATPVEWDEVKSELTK